MRKKRILTEEHKKKLAESARGKKKIFSAEAIENIRIAAAKRKGVKRGPRSQRIKDKISKATKGIKKKNVAENPSWFPKGHKAECGFKKGLIPWNKGRPTDPEIVEKTASKLRGRKMSPQRYEEQVKLLRSIADKRRTGTKRRSTAAKQWSIRVRERDGNKCQRCGREEKLHAHHIIPWIEDESLSFEISIGITYCNSCHKKVEGFGPRGSNKGLERTKEHRENLSKSLKGRIPWNKGKKKKA